jgi:hypothetical protein
MEAERFFETLVASQATALLSLYLPKVWMLNPKFLLPLTSYKQLWLLPELQNRGSEIQFPALTLERSTVPHPVSITQLTYMEHYV